MGCQSILMGAKQNRARPNTAAYHDTGRMEAEGQTSLDAEINLDLKGNVQGCLQDRPPGSAGIDSSRSDSTISM